MIGVIIPGFVNFMHKKWNSEVKEQIMGKQKHIKLSSVANQEPDVNEVDRQKLHNGLRILARIIAE